nr:MAG TPA: hypothetical protein [Caudoviricetes sp.]
MIYLDLPCLEVSPPAKQTNPTNSQHKTRDLPPDCSTWNARLV